MKRFPIFPMLVMGLCVVSFACTNSNSKKAKTTSDSVSTEQEQPIKATSKGKLKGFEWLEGNWFGDSYSGTATIRITPKYYQLAWDGPITSDTPKINYTISKKYDDPDDDEYWIDPDESIGFSKGDEETIEINVGVSDIIYLSKGDYKEVEEEDRMEREEFNHRDDPQYVFEHGFDEDGYLCFSQKNVERNTPDGTNVLSNYLYLHPYSNSEKKYRGKVYVLEYDANPFHRYVFLTISGDYEAEGDHLRVFNLHSNKKNFNDHNYQISVEDGDLRLIGPEIADLNDDVGGYRGWMKQCFADREYCAIIEKRNEF